jgi:coenzyme PQQ precursor peptide PqqA
MIVPIRRGCALRNDGVEEGRPWRRFFEGKAAPLATSPGKSRSSVMKWETPQATDFRFGMEITMYIAKR